jgi:hypothetical protein
MSYGQSEEMARGTSTSAARTRRGARGRSAAGTVVGQITQLVAANENLKLENAKLQALNEQLRAQLEEIGSALGMRPGGRRRGSRGATTGAFTEARPRQKRRPVTDPKVLARRNAALVKARAVRAERLAAARAAATSEQGA